MKQPIVFISYSHLDESDPLLKTGSDRWLSYVRSHLDPAAAHGKLELWDDRQIDAGGNWHRDIEDALNRCAVCVFLVSRHSLSSRFILDVEMKRMLERHHAGGAHLYPIVITSVDLGAAPWLFKLNLKPTNGTALNLYEEGPRDKVMSDLAAEIRQIIERTAADAATAYEISRVKERVEEQKELINNQQNIINQLVIFSMSFHIYNFLRDFVDNKYHEFLYISSEHKDIIRFLRDNGFIGMVQIRRLQEGENIVGKIVPTPIGRFYVEQRDKFERVAKG